ncbi:hypothetical protein ACOB6C_005356 [Escherichia coli]
MKTGRCSSNKHQIPEQFRAVQKNESFESPKFAFTSPAASRRWQVEAFFVSKKAGENTNETKQRTTH